MQVLISPKECERYVQIKLPQPRDGSPKLYLYDDDNIVLYEVYQFLDQHRSWFLDDSFCKKGHFNLVTRVDPLFIFVPIIMKHANDKFRTLHDICSSFATANENSDSNKLDFALSPGIEWKNICDIKELDDELYVRFSLQNTLNWLVRKHEKTMAALEAEMSDKVSKATLISYASDLIEMYIPQSISDRFKPIARDNFVKMSKTDDNKDGKASKQIFKEGKRAVNQKPSPSAPSILNFFKKQKN